MKKSALLSICLGFSVVAFTACSEPEEDKSQICLFTGLECKNGELYRCVDGVESVADACGGNGCDTTTDTCNTSLPTGCTYEGNQCRNGKLYICNAGVESVADDCNGLGCDNTTHTCKSGDVSPDKCAYTGSICKEGKIYQCTNGVESVADDCNDLGCDNTTHTCKSGDVSPDKCQDGEYYCMDGKIYGCVSGIDVLVEDCGDLGCDENGCIGDGTDECTADMCSLDGRNLMKCEDGQYQLEPCIAGCSNGACKDAACSATPTTCYDNKTRYECSAQGQYITIPCPDGQGCVNNKCVDATSEATCDFETSCSDDNRGIRKCEDGKATFEACPNAKSCDDSDGEVKCIDTVVKGVCTALFNDYCEDSRYLYSCEDPDKAGPERRDCGRGKCLGNRCVVNTKTFGDDCNPDTFDRTCIDNQIAYCDKGSKKVSREAGGNCAADGGICGITQEGLMFEVQCYEPCTVKGSIRNSCLISSDQTSQYQEECILVDSGIGDGRLGYSYVANSLAACDIGCSQGKCFDYTQDIPNIGDACNPDTQAGFCQGDLAVTCSWVDSDDPGYLLTAEKCYVDETCVVVDGSHKVPTAACLESCTTLGSEKKECGGEPGTVGAKMVKTYKCVDIGGKYYYDSTDYSYEFCTNSTTCQDGQCI